MATIPAKTVMGLLKFAADQINLVTKDPDYDRKMDSDLSQMLARTLVREGTKVGSDPDVQREFNSVLALATRHNLPAVRNVLKQIPWDRPLSNSAIVGPLPARNQYDSTDAPFKDDLMQNHGQSRQQIYVQLPQEEEPELPNYTELSTQNSPNPQKGESVPTMAARLVDANQIRAALLIEGISKLPVSAKEAADKYSLSQPIQMWQVGTGKEARVLYMHTNPQNVNGSPVTGEVTLNNKNQLMLKPNSNPNAEVSLANLRQALVHDIQLVQALEKAHFPPKNGTLKQGIDNFTKNPTPFMLRTQENGKTQVFYIHNDAAGKMRVNEVSVEKGALVIKNDHINNKNTNIDDYIQQISRRAAQIREMNSQYKITVAEKSAALHNPNHFAKQTEKIIDLYQKGKITFDDTRKYIVSMVEASARDGIPSSQIKKDFSKVITSLAESAIGNDKKKIPALMQEINVASQTAPLPVPTNFRR